MNEEKETMWEKGVLGGHSPQASTIEYNFLCGLFFVLGSGEHRYL